MPMFPVYACLMVNRLMCGFVAAASTYTNDNTIRERSLGAFDLELYREVVNAHNETLKAIKDCVDNDTRWVN